MSDRLIGKTLAGRFVLEEVLGTGATGSVYRAQQTSVDRVVAVKTLHPFLQEREDFKARFEIEAKAIARLNHPNCITLYDFGYDAEFDLFYMAVEYIKGDSLADLMAETIPFDDVLSIAYQVADALDHAHREGILHRDLKPENIMIQVLPDSGRQSVKVLDFGLARLYETALDDGDEPPSGRYKQITEAGQVYGTPAYMSPEQCRANSELTPATDIYALGTMMFELLEGRLPFFSRSTAELIMMQMMEEPPQMERRDVPLAIRNLIHRMMKKDPAERPQSAKEVLVALMAYVRLDASQELRIMPNSSGEVAMLTSEQIALLSASSSGASAQPRARVDTLDLSSDELRAAQPLSRGRAIWAAAALGVVALVTGIALTSANTPVNEPEPVTVDAPATGVADSPSVEIEARPDEPVEVADNGDDVTQHAKKEPKRTKPLKQKTGATSKNQPAPARPDSGAVSGSTVADDPNRPKTLKLTY